MNTVHQRRLFVILVSAVLALGALVIAPSAHAQTGPATRYLRQRNDEVNTILRRAARTPDQRTQRSAEVTRILSDLLDYQELARRSLGTHWDQHTEAERREFVDLLRQLVERNYEQNLERVLEFEVSYTSETADTDGTVVRTEARSRTERRQPPVEITYTLHLQGNAWRVFDVVTDGVSLVRNYRNQFNRIITENGWPALITRMRDRLAQPASGR
ncbi:MAG: ABC transporter substrate-binding protein [Deltaproteobacteria bacterium]|nr:ABC transporter substrate-binding protein [Deltaproteobacteria bacterium]